MKIFSHQWPTVTIRLMAEQPFSVAIRWSCPIPTSPTIQRDHFRPGAIPTTHAVSPRRSAQLRAAAVLRQGTGWGRYSLTRWCWWRTHRATRWYWWWGTLRPDSGWWAAPRRGPTPGRRGAPPAALQHREEAGVRQKGAPPAALQHTREAGWDRGAHHRRPCNTPERQVETEGRTTGGPATPRGGGVKRMVGGGAPHHGNGWRTGESELVAGGKGTMRWKAANFAGQKVVQSCTTVKLETAAGDQSLLTDVPCIHN